MGRLRTAIAAAALAVFTGGAGAVPTVLLGPGNVGIDNIAVAFDPVTNTITIEEFWTSAGLGSLIFRGLDPGVSYTVVKIIHNDSGIAWTRLANELLDPEGQAEDAFDVLPYPGFVPPGFTTSNDTDGLSFAQGSPIPRTSTTFAGVLVDELTDVRDFIDFFNGLLADGAVDIMTFGLRENFGTQLPFLLVQRPNQSSRVPEPNTLALMGIALAALGALRRRKAS